MLKKYIVLLSSLMACSSRAMNYEDLSESEQLRYMIIPDQQFSDIYAVEKEIKKGIADLRKEDQLTEDAVLIKIKDALKPYESKPSVLSGLQKFYKYEDNVVSARVNVNQRVYKYDVSETGSRVALLSADGDGVEYISVYAEASRGNWECISNMLALNVKNIYLIHGGKKLAILDKQENVSFENLDSTSDNLDHEILMKEAKKKHTKNFRKGLCGVVYERHIMESNVTEKSIEKVIEKSTGKLINIEQSGFRVDYTPRLKEIARYLVRQNTSEASTQSLEANKK